MQENKRYKGLKTGKWISIWSLVPGLLLTVRSARYILYIMNELRTRNTFSVATQSFMHLGNHQATDLQIIKIVLGYIF